MPWSASTPSSGCWTGRRCCSSSGCRRAMRSSTTPGSPGGCRCTSPHRGHVLLAHGRPELQERILRGPLPRYTDNTITTPDALRAALAETHRRGYALVEGHVHEDAAGAAVPVRGALNEVVAAPSPTTVTRRPTCRCSWPRPAASAPVTRSARRPG